MSSSRFRRSVLVLLLAIVFAPDPGGADPIPGAPFLRADQPWIAAVLSEAPALAPTLRGLIERLRDAHVIVYLVELERPGVGWDGRVRYISATPVARYLRIELRRLSPPRTAAVLAHELQHVAEIVDADIRSATEFDALFHRIGFVVPGTPGHVDTVAAIRAGMRTLKELQGVPPSAFDGPHGRR